MIRLCLASKQPWQMTKSELESFIVPSEGDTSADPGSIAQMREEGGTLLDYADDNWMIRDWLGAHSHEAGWDVSHLAEQVQNNEPITVYRATDTEDAIFPGAYVTPSKQYAIDHGERQLSGEHLMEPVPYKLLSLVVRPDELVAMNPLEFYYAPADIFAWHEQQIKAALEAGEDVPNEVLYDYHHLTEGSVRLNLRLAQTDYENHPFRELWQLDAWAKAFHEMRQDGLSDDEIYDYLKYERMFHGRHLDAIYGRFKEIYGDLYGYTPEIDIDSVEFEENGG